MIQQEPNISPLEMTLCTFAHFQQGNLLSETLEYAEIDIKSGDKSDDDSMIPPLLSVEETNVLDSGNESNDEVYLRRY